MKTRSECLARIVLIVSLFLPCAAQGQTRDAQKEQTEKNPTKQVLNKVGGAIVRVITEGNVYKKGEGGLEPKGFDGTGFIIDPEGFILTSYHVIFPERWSWDVQPMSRRYDNTLVVDKERQVLDIRGQIIGSPKIYVELRGLNFLALPAKLVGFDELSDLAILKIVSKDTVEFLRKNSLLDREINQLPRLLFSKDYDVGDEVLAVGFARSFEQFPTVTKGIISGIGRSAKDGTFSGLIQTDAVLNKGNSGGPLLDMGGNVVGISTGGWDTTEVDYSSKVDVVHGIFYARSSDVTLPLLERLLAGKRIRRPTLGIRTRTVTQSMAATYKFRALGVMVDEIETNSPIRATKLKLEDVITQIESIDQNGLPDKPGGINTWLIFNEGNLTDCLAFLKPGQKVRITFYHPLQMVLDAFHRESPLLFEDSRHLAPDMPFFQADIRVPEPPASIPEGFR
jgi:S1-C subfamily serine protease